MYNNYRMGKRIEKLKGDEYLMKLIDNNSENIDNNSENIEINENINKKNNINDNNNEITVITTKETNNNYFDKKKVKFNESVEVYPVECYKKYNQEREKEEHKAIKLIKCCCTIY